MARATFPVEVLTPEGEVVRFAQAEGYLQFQKNHALVLVEEAIAPEALDRAALQQRLAEARASAERAQEGSEQQARALRDIARWEAFLEVAQ